MFFKKKTSDETDAGQVVYTASVLNVSEFRLFELAYEDWFGEPGPETALEAACRRMCQPLQSQLARGPHSAGVASVT